MFLVTASSCCSFQSIASRVSIDAMSSKSTNSSIEAPKIRLRIWYPAKERVGHVALEIFFRETKAKSSKYDPGTNYLYVSFWGNEAGKQLYENKTVSPIASDDVEFIGSEPDYEYEEQVDGLDKHAIWSRYESMKKKASSGTVFNCTSAIRETLDIWSLEDRRRYLHLIGSDGKRLRVQLGDYKGFLSVLGLGRPKRTASDVFRDNRRKTPKYPKIDELLKDFGNKNLALIEEKLPVCL